MLNRRTFLKSSSLLALAPTVPLFVSQTGGAAPAGKDQRVLVVVQLDGGNDALNTVVAYGDPNYQKLRPRLKLDKKSLVPLADGLGLHASLKPLDKMLQAGHLAVIPGVGYPNPNRSHFESMAIWQTARFDAEERHGYGWLGRALDPTAGTAYAIGGDGPTALRGRRRAGPSVRIRATTCSRSSDDKRSPPIARPIGSRSWRTAATADFIRAPDLRTDSSWSRDC
jgi:uncharacterized protein (DUF1501 family)